jgi:hypothetical protein
LEQKTGISGFDTSVFQIPGARRGRECSSWDGEVLKLKKLKADGGVVWSWNKVTYFSILGFGFSAILRTRGQGHFALEIPEVEKRDIYLE